MNLIKAIFISLGTLSLCIGIIGIIVPGLPTTPFLLLTAGLYLRSSDRLYNKLISNKLLGTYISEFHAKKGISKSVKVYIIMIMWIMIVISCIFLITGFPVKAIVVAAGIVGTIVMGLVIPTVN